jgi:hypothetical protein
MIYSLRFQCISKTGDRIHHSWFHTETYNILISYMQGSINIKKVSRNLYQLFPGWFLSTKSFKMRNVAMLCAERKLMNLVLLQTFINIFL